MEIHEDRPPGSIWSHLPVTPSIPLPTIPEIKRHAERDHMRPKAVILADQALKLRLLNDLIDGPNPVHAMRDALVAPPPPLPPRPKPRNTKPAPRLSQKAPEERWSPYVLRHRQTRTGWSSEAQLGLRDFQHNQCHVCGDADPSCFDVVADDEHQEVFGYVCRRCKGALDLLGHDPIRFGRAQDFILNSPAKRFTAG